MEYPPILRRREFGVQLIGRRGSEREIASAKSQGFRPR
jgi:hypothetical protein